MSIRQHPTGSSNPLGGSDHVRNNPRGQAREAFPDPVEEVRDLAAAGAAGGALAIMEFIPEKYKHMISGPSLQVDVHTGAIAETILSFGITFAALLIIIRGPRRLLAKTFLLALATLCFVVAGSKYTGPAMNPAIVSIHWFTFLKR